ncbi:MAG: 50S ribosomal protein L11 methyltransferase [Anaerolineae bacterium]|nr:50S ribosomal protein L11 methyltransferase [Anaerolineae bacterium]
MRTKFVRATHECARSGKHAFAPTSMTNLKPNTVLQRAPYVRLTLNDGDYVHVRTAGNDLYVADDILVILDVFAQPRALSEGLTLLQQRITGAIDWMQLTSTMLRLLRHGVLRELSGRVVAPAGSGIGFEAPAIHVAMLNDHRRTECYIAAIQTVVQPGDIVVDIGTGSGVLAMAAARAGARHVYAIEAGRMGRAAEAVFAANGFAEQITLLRGWSTHVTLPVRADVLVSEIIGNEPLSENVLEFTSDARQRLLQPHARLIPGRVRILALPLVVPPDIVAEQLYTPAAVQQWQAWYNIDFAPLLDYGQGTLQTFAASPHVAGQWPAIAAPVLLADIDLQQVTDLVIIGQGTTTTAHAGTLNGLGIFFELQLSPLHTLSNDPRLATPDCSWRMPVWLLKSPLAIQAGERITITYQHGTGTLAEKISITRG